MTKEDLCSLVRYLFNGYKNTRITGTKYSYRFYYENVLCHIHVVYLFECCALLHLLLYTYYLTDISFSLPWFVWFRYPFSIN